MSDEAIPSVSVRPLTKRTAAGTPYARRPEVEAQIAETATMPLPDLAGLIVIPDPEAPGYLYDETLVYLLREAFLSDDTQKINLVYDELSVRVERLLRRCGRQLGPDDRPDLAQKVHRRLLEKISDRHSDRADYAQVMFGDFVVSESRTVIRSMFREAHRSWRDVELDAPNEEGQKPELADTGLSQDMVAELQNALDRLPQETAAAFRMHYLEGFQIESGDPSEPTVAGCFEVSGRTIRNWFRRAAEQLAGGEGGAE